MEVIFIDDPNAPLNPLTPHEKEELEHHLTIIEGSFARMVKSLAHIYYTRLYRGDDGRQTWAQFCERRLNFSARHGHYFVKAFDTLQTITESELPPPTKLAQTRALSAIPKDYVLETWAGVYRQFGDKATAKNITTIYNDLKDAGAVGSVARTLATLADTDEGKEAIGDVLVTGYLQWNDSIVPIEQANMRDIENYTDAMRREARARELANEGGMLITIYPDNAEKTRANLEKVLTDEQINALLIAFNPNPFGVPVYTWDEFRAILDNPQKKDK